MLGVRFVIVPVVPNRVAVKTGAVFVTPFLKKYPVIVPGPDGAVKLIVHPVKVILDEVNPVGGEGAVVRETGADCAEDPVTVLLAIAVTEYIVFDVAPVNAAGLLVLVVVGPEGDTVKTIDVGATPNPPVHAILKVLVFMALGVDKIGVVGPVVYDTVDDADDHAPAELCARTAIEYLVFGFNPVKVAVLSAVEMA